MSLIRNQRESGYMCPGCYVFSHDPNEISHHDGTCVNCHEYFIMPVTIEPGEHSDHTFKE